MQKGYDLIYHAYLIDENFRGEADFLIKTNTPLILEIIVMRYMTQKLLETLDQGI
jgi:hypothetical protein